MGNTSSRVEEKKQQVADDNSDDNEQECVVNETDCRKPVHDVASIRDLPIIKCIGQIETEYKYKIKHGYKGTGYGTGTVYRVTNNGYAFILTCGHNIRNQIKYCSSCDTYNNLMRKCNKCNNKCDKKKVIMPTAIQFHRRTTKSTNFGQIEKTYECREIYVPKAYIPLITKEKKLFGEKGFDFAILMFHDDGYYTKNCRHIKIDIGFNVLQQNKRFCIFGYPGPDRQNKYPDVQPHKLYGYEMISDVEEKAIEFKPCDSSYYVFKFKTEYVLRQREIDCSPGQSGSALFVKRNNEAIICGIHIDGHAKNDNVKDDYSYNRTTLLSAKYICIMSEVQESKYEEKDTDIYTAARLLQNKELIEYINEKQIKQSIYWSLLKSSKSVIRHKKTHIDSMLKVFEKFNQIIKKNNKSQTGAETLTDDVANFLRYVGEEVVQWFKDDCAMDEAQKWAKLGTDTWISLPRFVSNNMQIFKDISQKKDIDVLIV